MATLPTMQFDVQERQSNWLIGVASIGGIVTGLGGLFAAFLAFTLGQWQAVGICLIAAALAFGALANAALRR